MVRCIAAVVVLMGGVVCFGAQPATAPAATRPAATQPAVDARVALDGFLTALKAGDAEKAREHVATFDRPNDPMLRNRLQRLAERKSAPLVLEVKQGERAAVAVVREGPRDIDPAYLVKRDGRFLMMPGISRYRGGIVKLTPEEEAEFRSLERWFEDQKVSRQQ